MTWNKKMIMRFIGISKFRRRKYQWFRALGSRFQSCRQTNSNNHSEKVFPAILFYLPCVLKYPLRSKGLRDLYIWITLGGIYQDLTKKGGGFIMTNVFWRIFLNFCPKMNKRGQNIFRGFAASRTFSASRRRRGRSNPKTLFGERQSESRVGGGQRVQRPARGQSAAGT